MEMQNVLSSVGCTVNTNQLWFKRRIANSTDVQISENRERHLCLLRCLEIRNSTAALYGSDVATYRAGLIYNIQDVELFR